MSDLSKCPGEGCPLAENCYRFTAKADPMCQSYILPQINDKGECIMYWPVKVSPYYKE